MVTIERISADLAEQLCRNISQDLPEYFGLSEANERYACGVRSRINFAAKVGEEYVGLISVEFPYPENVSIYWLGILRAYHRKGIGQILSKKAFGEVQNRGAKTISVETVSPQEAYENCLKTCQFHKSLGFTPLFNLKPRSYE